MWKKIFLSGLILLSATLATGGAVAALAATSGSTTVTGQVTSPTISITAPSAITFPSFSIGDVTGSSATPGTVTVTAGTAGYPVPYSVLAADSNTGEGSGFMMNGIKPLSSSNKFLISSNTTSYYPSDTGFTYSGSITGANVTILLPYYVKQHISGNETAGNYTITVTFTASLP